MAGPVLSLPRLPAKWAALLLAALIVLPPLALLRLHVNNAPAVYLPAHAPAVAYEREIRKHLPEDDVLVVLLERDGLFEADFLNALDRVAGSLEGHRWIDRVLTVTTLDHIAGTQDGFTVERLLGPTSLEGRTPTERRKRATEDRFAPGRVVAPGGDLLALVVRPIPLSSSLARTEVYDVTRAALAEAGLSGAVTGMAGHVALDVAEFRSMIFDTLAFTPATVAIGLVLIGGLFRRLLAVAVTALALAAVVSSTVALLALWGRPFNLISALIPPLMAALTVAFLVHLFTSLRHASVRGLRGADRVARALADIRRPAFYTAVTTALGLASLGLSPIPPIQALGLASAAGMGVLYLTTMTLLPPLLVRWDVRPWPGQVRIAKAIERLVSRVGRFAMRQAGWVVLVAMVGLGLLAPRIADVTAETDLYHFFAPSHPLIQATHRVESKLSGVTTLDVVFEASRRDALKDPARLAAIQGFQDWVDELPEVDRSLSLVETIQEMHWAFHSEDPAFRRLPDNQALISQYLFVYDGRDLYDLVDREFRRTRVALNLDVHGANQIQQVIVALQSRLRAKPPADLDWHITGMGRLLADQEDLLIQGQVRSLWAALGVIFLLMLLLWRSLSAALLCLLPNLAPIVFIFSLMGLLGIWLDFATAMIASVAVGIAVDDTIHVYAGFARRRARGQRVTWALARTLRQAGLAVTITTTILVAQFLLLTTSQFVPTVQFGALTAVGLAAALVFDVALLPALLALAAAARRRRAA